MSTVLLTNSVGSLEGLSSKISSEGFNVIHLPMIKVTLLGPAVVGLSIQNLSSADYILLTSTYSARWLVESGFDLEKMKIICLGESAKNYLEEYGGSVDFISKVANSSGLVSTVTDHIPKGSSILFLHGSLSGDSIINELHLNDYQVTDFCVYETNNLIYSDSESSKLVESSDYVVFTSPSCVSSYFKQFELDSKFVISIGPTTSLRLEDNGVFDILEVNKPSVESIVECLLEHK